MIFSLKRYSVYDFTSGICLSSELAMIGCSVGKTANANAN